MEGLRLNELIPQSPEKPVPVNGNVPSPPKCFLTTVNPLSGLTVIFSSAMSMHEAILLVRTITEMVISVGWSTIGAVISNVLSRALAGSKQQGLVLSLQQLASHR